MNGVVALAEKDRSTPPAIGDLVTVDILIDEKLGQAGDEWRLLGKSEEKWVVSGGLTLSASSLRVLPSSEGTTRLAVDGMVHQSGPLSTGEILLKHLATGTEVKVAPGALSAEVAAMEQTETPPPWFLPAVPFGGWNYVLLGILALILITLMGLLLRKLIRRVARRRRKNHKDRALATLQNLQKYARNKHGIRQEEWKKFSFELAGIVRKFSDENFRIDSSDMTDREFLTELRLHPKARTQVDALAQVLGTIDEVRYGKKALDATVVPNLLLEARRFVESTYLPKDGEGA